MCASISLDTDLPTGVQPVPASPKFCKIVANPEWLLCFIRQKAHEDIFLDLYILMPVYPVAATSWSLRGY
jgi:hypothetical protein